MLAGVVVRGLLINLDRCVARREAMERELDRVDLKAASYVRLAAIEPVGDEPQLSRGLKSRGELGIWLSIVAALEQMADQSFADVVHLIEDDVVFVPAIAGISAELTQLMLSDSPLKTVDIVFLDYFMNRELCGSMIARQAQLGASSLGFISASRCYLASCCSMLIRRASAPYLAAVLSRILASANPLPPVDFALRSLLQIGAITGVLSVPPLGAPAWELDEQTNIQFDVDPTMRCSQRAHLLLRILAAGVQTPVWCGARLAELYGVNNPLQEESNADAFLAFFDTLAPRMVPF